MIRNEDEALYTSGQEMLKIQSFYFKNTRLALLFILNPPDNIKLLLQKEKGAGLTSPSFLQKSIDLASPSDIIYF